MALEALGVFMPKVAPLPLPGEKQLSFFAQAGWQVVESGWMGEKRFVGRGLAKTMGPNAPIFLTAKFP